VTRGIPSDIEQQLIEARRRQLAARQAWARSPNAHTIACTSSADHYLDALLDRLLETLRREPARTR
jgi:hypothetical protein